MGIGVGGIVPIRIAIGGIELALPGEDRSGLTPRPAPAGQPTPTGKGDVFHMIPMTGMIGPNPAVAPGRAGREDRKPGRAGALFRSGATAAIMEQEIGYGTVRERCRWPGTVTTATVDKP